MMNKDRILMVVIVIVIIAMLVSLVTIMVGCNNVKANANLSGYTHAIVNIGGDWQVFEIDGYSENVKNDVITVKLKNGALITTSYVNVILFKGEI